MKIVCTVCVDTLSNEGFSAAPCGHTFHHTCLLQWLDHKATCPQCRIKCPANKVLKLFFSSGSTDTEEYSSLSPEELKETLEALKTSFKQKEEAFKATDTELNKVKEQLRAWRSQNESLLSKLDLEKATCDSLKHEMKQLQVARERAESMAKETDNLRKHVVKLKRIEKLLECSRDQASNIIDTSSVSQLKSYVTSLKSEYNALKERKAALQKDRDSHAHDISQLKCKLHSQEEELYRTKERLSFVERDLRAAEAEKENLTAKVRMLERAIESPGSKQALRRMLESPLPDALSKKPKLDVDTSPLLVPRQTQQDEANLAKKEIEETRVLVPVQKLSSAVAKSRFSTGFNGLGGHSSFIAPSARPLKPVNRTGKTIKFNPRVKGGRQTTLNLLS